MVLVARTGALHEGHRFRRFAVGGPQQLPPVGPSMAASRSSITLVTTLAYLPKPRLSSLAASYGFHPVATITEPTLKRLALAPWARSIAPYLHASAQAWQPAAQAARSITYVAGKAANRRRVHRLGLRQSELKRIGNLRRQTSTQSPHKVQAELTYRGAILITVASYCPGEPSSFSSSASVSTVIRGLFRRRLKLISRPQAGGQSLGNSWWNPATRPPR